MVIKEEVIKIKRDDEYDCQCKSYESSSVVLKYRVNNTEVHKLLLNNNLSLYFELNNKIARILSSTQNLNSNILDDVCDYIFNNYVVDKIVIEELINQYNSKYLTSKRWGGSDVLMDIPDTIDDYLSYIGKSTKQNIKRYINKLNKLNADVEFKVYKNKEITKEQVTRLLSFNEIRLNNVKNINVDYKDSYIEEIFDISNEYGVLHAIEINGEQKALFLINNIGGDYFLSNLGSDMEYEKYHIGLVCLYKTIEYTIENRKEKDNKYHFMYELTDYKKRFGGNEINLTTYEVFNRKNINYYVSAIKNKIEYNLMFQIKRNENVKKLIKKLRKAGLLRIIEKFM